MIVTMLVAQLFHYEDFASTLAVVLPTHNQQLTEITAAAIVLAELLALPYLSGMYLSTLMRFLSASLGATVSLFWLLIALTNAHATNSALLSTTIQLPGGLVAVVWALLLVGFYIVVAAADSRFRHDVSS